MNYFFYSKAVTNCNVTSLSFEGNVTCKEETDQLKCDLKCPDNGFLSEDSQYICNYETGSWLPDNRPYCRYGKQ